MKKFLFFVFLFGALAGPAVAQTPACQLGTPYAVNPSRLLTAGERIIRATGGSVIIEQREAPGSSHIAFRRCNLPAETEVVIGGTTPWVKVCGNNFTLEGWVLPTPPPTPGPQGPIGPQGPKGDKGDPGTPGKDAPAPAVQVIPSTPAPTAPQQNSADTLSACTAPTKGLTKEQKQVLELLCRSQIPVGVSTDRAVTYRDNSGQALEGSKDWAKLEALRIKKDAEVEKAKAKASRPAGCGWLGCPPVAYGAGGYYSQGQWVPYAYGGVVTSTGAGGYNIRW